MNTNKEVQHHGDFLTVDVRVSRYGPNILLNSVEGYQRPSVWQCLSRGDKASEATALRDFDNSVVSGFQLAALSGPMCEEPLMGVCFSVERWDVQSAAPPQRQDSVEEDSTRHEATAESNVEGSSETSARAEGAAAGQSHARRRPEVAASSDCYGPVSGQLIAAVKEACRHAFQAQPQRLMAAMYTCEIMATADVLGKRALLHAVVAQRRRSFAALFGVLVSADWCKHPFALTTHLQEMRCCRNPSSALPCIPADACLTSRTDCSSRWTLGPEGPLSRLPPVSFPHR